MMVKSTVDLGSNFSSATCWLCELGKVPKAQGPALVFPSIKYNNITSFGERLNVIMHEEH